MKIKFTVIIILLLSAGVGLSKSINKLSIDTVGRVSYWSNTDILNEQLFFQDSFTEYLWVTDGTNNGSRILEHDQQPIQLNLHRKTLKAYQGSIYFINKSDGNTLWKTDGNNFEQVSNNSFSISKGLKIYSNHLVGVLSDNSLVLINENGTQSLDLAGLSNNSMSSICIFGQNDFIIDSHFPDSPNHLYHVKDGEALIIDENIPNFGSFSLSVVNNDNCFYKYTAGDFQEAPTPSFIAVDESGVVTAIRTDINGQNTTTWAGVVEFKNSIYFYPVRAVGDSNDISLYRYESPSLVKLDNFLLRSNTIKLTSSNGFLYVQRPFDSVPSPEPPGFINKQIDVYNVDFARIATLQGSRTGPSIISLSNNQDMNIIKDGYNLGNGLKFISQSGDTINLPTPTISITKAFSDSGNTYIYGSDKNNNNKPSIYVVNNQAVVSQNFDGLWYTPEHQSQGLSIHTGERVDGSQYLFASYYFFKDGVPFWIAGSTDLNFEPSLTLTMYEYTGSSPYVPNNTGQNHQQIEYGDLTLEALSCNQLNFQMNLPDNSSFNLDMQRLGRSQSTPSCVD